MWTRGCGREVDGDRLSVAVPTGALGSEVAKSGAVGHVTPAPQAAPDTRLRSKKPSEMARWPKGPVALTACKLGPPETVPTAQDFPSSCKKGLQQLDN